jgi:hypothetical protein
MIEDVSGLGELWAYDTALRLGAHLGHLPARVYLHRGTRKGAENLGLNVTGETIEVKDLPDALRSLPPHESEDILCIYKDGFRSKRP